MRVLIFYFKQTTAETAWTTKANFPNLFNPMMPLPGRYLANVTSNFNTILWMPSPGRNSADMASILGPLTPSLLTVVWGQVAVVLLRRFVPFSHAVTWGWIAEQRSPLVPLVFSRTWGNPHYLASFSNLEGSL